MVSQIAATDLINASICTDLARKSVMDDETFTDIYGNRAWYLYGGHRLWITPESAPETYYPDNEEVKFEYTDNGAVFTPNAQIKNDIQMQIEVVMADSGTLLWVLGLGFVTAFLPYVLYSYGLEKMESSKASILASVEPVVSALFGVFVFHETLSLVGVVGIILVLAAIVVLNKKAKK